MRYRLGLAPRRAGGRVTGFTVRSNVEMPALARAGIRPGDVIVGVNGSVFDEERMQELAWQIANSDASRLRGRTRRPAPPARPCRGAERSVDSRDSSDDGIGVVCDDS